ncbi:unnamed protein product, partial [Phaeothamnion confervicola]
MQYLNVSSDDRDKALYATSSDCAIDFDKIDTVSSIRLKHAEIPHTRYAISTENNTLYFSEFTDSAINFYHVQVSEASYTASELGTTLTLSMLCPYGYNTDIPPSNTYSFSTAGNFGKMAMISSGDVPYALHLADETVTLNTFTLVNTTEALITFFSSRDYLFARGALLTLKLVPYSDREVLAIDLYGANGIRVMGDFSDVDTSTIKTSTSTMIPYSSINNISLVMGFSDADMTSGSSSTVLGVQTPWYSDVTNLSTVMVTTNLPNFVSTGSTVRFSSPGLMDRQVFTVSKVKDDTHFEVDVDRRLLWANTSGKLAVASNPAHRFPVASISIFDVDKNVISLTIDLSGPNHDLVPNEQVSFIEFSSPEMSSIVATVLSV